MMTQVQTAQQPPQSGVTAELYTQVEEYLSLGSLIAEEQENQTPKKKRKVIKRKSARTTETTQEQEDEESESLSSERLAVKINGKTVRGSAYEIVSRMVEAEMGATFQPEALKAQAVAAYSYVRFHNQAGTPPSVAAKNNPSTAVKEAVKEVLGEAIYYDGKVINATYSASNAGQSMDSEHVWGNALPYLVSVESPGDTTLRAYGATKTFSEEEIAERISDELGIDPYEFGSPEEWFSNPEYINGQYVDTIEVCGEVVSGRKVREELLDFQINSAAFEVEYDGQFTFTTYGYGHGVGLSQQGADYYAMQGWNYEEILTHYYTDTTVQ